MKYPLKPFVFSLLTALGAVLVACGGGSSSPPSIAMTTINTTVMDGLIQGAKVCVDSNNNGHCEQDEIFGITDSNGNVTLSIPTADLASASLLAIVGNGARDADTGDVTTTYTLKNPAGQLTVISPLTNMVRAKMDAEHVTLAIAENFVQTQTGLTVSVMGNYIANRAQPAYAQAAQAARLLVASTQAALNTPEAQTNCGTTGAPTQAQINLQHTNTIESNLLGQLSNLPSALDQINELCTSASSALDCNAAFSSHALSAPACPGTPQTQQTITFDGPASLQLGTGTVSLIASASSGLTVTFSSGTNAICTVVGNTLALVSEGECRLTASQLGSSSYIAASPVTRIVTVAPAPVAQTITFASPGNQLMGSSPATLSAAASSGLPVQFTSGNSSVCTINGNTLTLVSAGTCTIIASQSGSIAYTAAPSVNQSFNVAQIAQTISFSSPGNQTLGNAQAALSATATSGLTAQFGSSTPSVCTVSGTTLTLVSPGTCNIYAAQPGDRTYAAAPTQTHSFFVVGAQTISFTAPSTQTMGAMPPALSATATSSLAVQFASTTPSVCTVSGTTVTLLAAGTCSISASQPGSNIYTAAPLASQSFTVALATQAISFTAPPTQTLTVTPPALSATASSSLPVQYASGTPSVCTVSGITLNLVSAGTCTITATQAGNGAYSAATPVPQSFTVAQAAQTIGFTAPPTQTMGVAPPALAASATSGLAVQFTSSTPAVCTVSSTTLTLVSEGTCNITASQPGNSSYAAAPLVAQSFAVALAAQTITFTTPSNQTLGVTPQALSATATSGLTVQFTASTPSVCTVSGTTLSLVSPGTCIITASQSGNSIYAAAPTQPRSFFVVGAQIISFTAPSTQTMGVTSAALSATATSGLAVQFASSTPSVCTVSGTALTLLASGTCTVTASQPGSSTYAAAPAVNQSFTVVQAAQSITFASPGDQILGSTPAALFASATSGLAVQFSSSTSSVCAVNGTTLNLVSPGTCIITASQPGNSTYAAAPTQPKSFFVVGAQTISFTAPLTQTMGATPPALSATATSGLDVQFTSTTPSVCNVSGTTLTLFAAGTCTISAAQSGSSTYSAAPSVNQSFTVVPSGTQIISFASPGNQTLGTTPAALSASANSGLPVQFASASPSVCMVNGTTLTLVSAGTCSITASQPGNGSYAAAPSVTQSFSVAQAMQTISFASPGDQSLGMTPAALSATATSGLTVQYGSNTSSVCTVSGTTLTLVSAGTCSIYAAQPGNTIYAAAPTQSRSFFVVGAQTISFTALSTQTLGATPPALSATATSGLSVQFASNTPLVCTVSGNTLTLVSAGTCSVSGSQAGSSTYTAAPTVTQSFSVAQATQAISFTSPGNQTMGSSPSALYATATSGLPVQFASNTPSVCTVNGTTLTLVSAGTCTITASQTGNSTYAAATPFAQSVAVALATQTLTFASPGNQTMGTAPTALSATATSGLTVQFASSTPSVCTVSGNTLTLASAGTCTITASQPGNNSYSAATVATRSVTVVQATQTISFTQPPDQYLNVTPTALSATATSGLTVQFSTSSSAVCTVSGATLTLVSPGTCIITASQPGNSIYAAAPTQPKSFFVVGTQSITFSSPGNQILGTTPAALSASATSGLSVQFTSSTASICTVSGTTLTLVASGTCTITASQSGSSTYSAATPVSQSFTVAAGGISAANGKVLYNQVGGTASKSCASVGCHTTRPAQNVNAVLNGANKPNVIAGAISNNTGQMGSLRGVFTSSQLADIAAYLATPNL